MDQEEFVKSGMTTGKDSTGKGMDRVTDFNGLWIPKNFHIIQQQSLARVELSGIIHSRHVADPKQWEGSEQLEHSMTIGCLG